MDHRPKQYLNIPAQTLTTLSFCDPNTRQLRAWVESLPMANIGETARQLYHAVIEFNKLKLNDNTRVELMDLLRGPIHYVCQSLNQKYLNQGVTLNEQQRKVANLAQALQTHLAIGYKIVVQHLLAQKTAKQKNLMPLAIHRLLSDLAPSLLRSYQLYIPTPPGLWLEIHQTYQTATAFNFHHTPIEDPVSPTRSSIENVYLKSIMLGACQPNQLLQRELTEVYRALDDWVGGLDITEVADDKSVLLINPESDHPPLYSYLIKAGSYANALGLNTTPLVRMLHAELKAQQGKGTQQRPIIKVPGTLETSLLEHLVQSWGGMKQRAFSRTQGSGRVTLSVGLTATHFHMSGGVGFYSQLCGRSEAEDGQLVGASARFDAMETQAIKSQQDVWEQSFDAGMRDSTGASNGQPIDFAHKKPQDPSAHQDPTQDDDHVIDYPHEEHPVYEGQLINISPRGYCIQWSNTVAGNLKAGEAVAVNEEKLKHWNLGVVRWLRQSKEAGTLMGVELIAPNSQPCGIRQLHKTGAHGDYLRGLFIPEIRAIGQAASVLIPRLSFQVGNKVTINLDGNEHRYQLIKRTLRTGILSQFQIRELVQKPLDSGDSGRNEPDDGFEGLWRQL